MRFLVENRRFNLPHLYLAPSFGVTPLEFHQDAWYKKLESMGIVCVILHLAVLLQFRLVTDRQTDGLTDT